SALNGRTSIRVERGIEFRPILDVMHGAGEKRIRLHRWIDMRKRGYASGENHSHVPTLQLASMLAAEDLTFGSSLSWWNGPRFAPPDGSEMTRTLSYGGHKAPTSVFDAEVENEWGAVYLIGLRTPLSIAAERPRSHIAFLREARRQGAMICYQAGWSPEAV